MARNDETPVGAGACNISEFPFACESEPTTTPLQMQQPSMGTELSVPLRRYVVNFRAYDKHHGNGITRQIINCAEILLIKGEWLEGGRP
jgi:hypothetical protein